MKNRFFDKPVYNPTCSEFPNFMGDLMSTIDSIYDINIETTILNNKYLYIIFSSISDLPIKLAKNFEIYKAGSNCLSERYVLVIKPIGNSETHFTNEINILKDEILQSSLTGVLC